MTACIILPAPPSPPPTGLGAEGIIIGGLNYAEGEDTLTGRPQHCLIPS